MKNLLLHLCLLALPLVAPASLDAQSVVINEINYDTSDENNPTEFLEFYNNSDAAVDMGGWSLKGVTYTFPTGTTIAPRGYLVVAADATAFSARWPNIPVLEWESGKLSNEGERIRLIAADGDTLIDDVTYGVGFPWPIAPRGEGPSLELINPNFDRKSPASWRAPGFEAITREPEEYVLPNDAAWRWRKGTSEASSPVSAWRQLDFSEDSSWQTGETSIGFGDDDDRTIITDMRNSYSCIFLRKKFHISSSTVPSSLTLGVRVDDGCIVWINGVEVARFHTSGKFTGEPAYNFFADNHEASASAFDEITLFGTNAYLQPGENVIAIQAFQSDINSSDFTIDAKLIESFASGSNPTPGARNSVYAENAPPAILAVSQDISQPAPNQAVTITATVEPFGASPVSSVKLLYQKVNPGAYIRKTDAAFLTNWTEITMQPQGGNLYSATIPAGVQTHRALIRYRIQATDTASITLPYLNDPEPNFAYFVYGSMPSWTGSFDGSTNGRNTYSPAQLQSLPTYQLIADGADVTNSQYNGSYNGQRFLGTLIYDGVVYDHIQYRNRGEGSTYVSGKNKWRIYFQNYKRLAARDNYGRPYAELWDKLSLNAAASPWCAVHRGMGGVEEAVSFRLYELLGMPASQTHHLHFRVITGTSENTSSQYQGGNPGNNYDGDLWGLYLAVENFDANFVDERGLDDGNIYKIENGGAGDLKHDGEDMPHDGSDWNAFLNASKSASTSDATWWRANMDLPAFYTFTAGNRILGNVDLREGWNHAFYHNPNGQWTVLPWDLDMMFIPKTHWSGTINQSRLLNVPELKREYQNRARELLDLVCEDASANGGQIGQLIDEMARRIGDPTDTAGTARNWATLDAAMWNKNPRTSITPSNAQTNHYGNFYKSPYTDSRFGGEWVRTLSTTNFAGSMKYLLEYSTNTFPAGQTWTLNNGNPRGYGYKYLETEAAEGDGANAPSRPPRPAYLGSNDFQNTQLHFSSGAYSGTNAFATVQWRLGEISAPGIPLYQENTPRTYEVTDVWRSEEIANISSPVTIPANLVQDGHTYRVRVRHKDTAGRWSRWSPAVEFIATSEPPITAQDLVVSELMYNPGSLSAEEITAAGTSDRQEFEFLELLNISQRTLDLSGVAFTEGITFTFPDNTLLAPGERLLLVKNTSAFTARYGAGLPIAGNYTGSLSNGGERLLLTSGGNVIQDFSYSDSSPWPTSPDGDGPSLVLLNPHSAPDHTDGLNWRASTTIKGNPGATDPITYAEWAARYAGLGGANDDDDQDGLDNLLEYALGSHPLTHNLQPHHGTASVETDPSNLGSARYLVFTFTRANDRGDLAYQVEFSSDLQSWSANGVWLESIDNGDGTTTERWRAAESSNVHSSLFARLKITN